MPLLMIDPSGAERLRMRLAQFQAVLMPAVLTAMETIGSHIEEELKAAAPKGQHEGPPPAGDAPGALADSFSHEVQGSEALATLQVKTSQPTKLMYVRKGTGVYGARGARITPTQKRALYWQGADHPVRSVAGMRPNDFVTPVLEDAKDFVAEQLSEAVGEVLKTP